MIGLHALTAKTDSHGVEPCFTVFPRLETAHQGHAVCTTCLYDVASKALIRPKLQAEQTFGVCWCSLGESNPCFRRERGITYTSTDNRRRMTCNKCKYISNIASLTIHGCSPTCFPYKFRTEINQQASDGSNRPKSENGHPVRPLRSCQTA